MRLPDLSVRLQALGPYYALEGRVQTTSSTGGFDSVVSRSRFYAAWTALDIACDFIDDNDPAFYVSLHKQNKRLCIFDINVFIYS